MNQINQVLIVGGTHGNELIGAYLVQKIELSPHLFSQYSFQVQTLLANPRAFAKGVRYIDQDLNRSFDRQSLQHSTQPNYETERAKEISQNFEANFDRATTFIIDLHSTTSNMELTLILDTNNPFTLKLVAHVSAKIPALKIYSSVNSGRSSDALRSLSALGLSIEVGAIAQGTLDADLFQRTEEVVSEILKYLEQSNRGALQPYKDELTLYQYLKSVDYPKDDRGHLRAMIHPQLQFKDYQALNPGDPMFLTFAYEAIAYAGESVTYPVFINEAAYYEKGIAMVLTERRQLELTDITDNFFEK
jgi:N-acyl-aromatic-L-amino acid amidohydrolase